MSNSDITKHDCDKNSDLFSYVCDKYGVQKNRRMKNDKIKDVYECCFNLKITNQNETWVPHSICSVCYNMFLRSGKSKDRKKHEKETDDTSFSNEEESKKSETFVQDELNDLVRDLGISKDKSEYLVSILKKKLAVQRSNCFLLSWRR